jgi:hypothetical protein
VDALLLGRLRVSGSVSQSRTDLVTLESLLLAASEIVR